MAPERIVLRQADTPELVSTARDLFREYAAAIGTDLEYQGFAAELASLPAPYVPPGGALLIARAGRKQLVESVIRAARDAGYRQLCLDTLPSMRAAQALYHRLGFIEIPPYNDKHLPGTRFFSLALVQERNESG